MLQSIIHRLLRRHHFWRHATFSEVAELYASRMMRIFALRLIAVFTAIFLYQEGYSLIFIALFFAGFYFLKVPFSYPSAKIAAKYGPKHGTLVSNIVSAAAMILLPFAGNNDYGIYALIGWLILQAFSGALNDLCYLIDFSKVKHSEHAGKEIGYMNIIEKIANAASPLIGGLLAFFAGPEAVMVLSAVFFLLSAIPLLQTPEQTRIHSKLDFSNFPWRATWRSFVAESAIGFDVFTTGNVWTLFLAVIIFDAFDDAVYAQIGALVSVTVFIALASSYMYGRLIDHRKGYELMRISTIANSLLHALRPFISTPIGVVLMNTVNEAATTGYAMPFMRGMFDTADVSHKRIEYLFIIEMVVNFGAAMAAVAFAGALWLMGDIAGFSLFFVIAACATLLIGTPKFALYRR